MLTPCDLTWLPHHPLIKKLHTLITFLTNLSLTWPLTLLRWKPPGSLNTKCPHLLGCYCCCPLVSQLCLTLCNPVDCSPPRSPVRGISQARILEWVVISYPRGSSWPRDQTCIFPGEFSTTAPPQKPPLAWHLAVSAMLAFTTTRVSRSALLCIMWADPSLVQ